MMAVGEEPTEEQEKRWRAERDIEALAEARRIAKDEERMAMVKKVLKEQVDAYKDLGEELDFSE